MQLPDNIGVKYSSPLINLVDLEEVLAVGGDPANIWMYIIQTASSGVLDFASTVKSPFLAKSNPVFELTGFAGKWMVAYWGLNGNYGLGKTLDFNVALQFYAPRRAEIVPFEDQRPSKQGRCWFDSKIPSRIDKLF